MNYEVTATASECGVCVWVGKWGGCWGSTSPLFGAMKRIRGRSKTAVHMTTSCTKELLALANAAALCLASVCCSFDISTVINGKCSASPQLATAHTLPVPAERL